MIDILFILAFIVCLAAAVGAALVSHAFVTTFNTAFHRHYFYYLATFYLFSLYAFWGQILGRVLLASLEVPAAIADTIASFVSILGIPMLFVSLLMLINLGHSMFGTTARQGWFAVHAVVFVLLILGALLAYPSVQAGTTAAGPGLTATIAASLVALEGAYFGFFTVLAVRGKRSGGDPRGYMLRFARLMVAAFVVRSLALPIAFLGPAGALVVLIYFGSNLVPLYYLHRINDRAFAAVGTGGGAPESLEQMLAPFGITKRERQIVEQICLGKTNQQIADTLFISLQTVKDHTHRIYGKIGIRNRLQLVSRINAGG